MSNNSIREALVRFCATLSVGVVVVGTGGAALVAVVHPAAATAALGAAVSAVTCATAGTTPCVSGTNTSSGIGVLGASNQGAGLRGTSNSNVGVKGTSTTGYGLYGSTASGTVGVYGISHRPQGFSVGVLGLADKPIGIGVSGETSSGAGTGVAGVAFTGVGISGAATDGTGIQAIATDGIAMDATSSTGPALEASSDSNAAIVAGSRGAVALYSDAATGNGAEISGGKIGVVGRSDNIPLYLSDGSGNLVFYVDGVGNFYAHGGLHTFGRAAGGGTVTAYAAKTAQPTFEDTGTAQLAGGMAAVALDPAFAASIDRRSGYRVFLTPDGETQGWLYVASKTPNGFIVREGLGGHTTTTFDYRIVATGLGDSGRRMALTPGGLPPGAPTAKLQPPPVRKKPPAPLPLQLPTP